MDVKEKSKARQQFDALLRQVTDNADHIKSRIPDDDLMLICCLMAEIVKIASIAELSQ